MKSKPTYEELEKQIVNLNKKYAEVLEQKENPHLDLFTNWKEMFKIIELIYDDNGKVINYYYRDVNPAFASLLGKKRTQLINKRVTAFGGTIEEYWLETYQKVDETGESIHFENYGAELDKYYNIYAWKIEDNLIGIIFNDITDRKKTEKKLLETNELNNDVEKIAQMGHWKLDIVKDKLYWSDETFRIFGLEPQQSESTYEAFLEYIHPEDRDKVNAAYINSLKDKESYEVEHRILLKNGKIKHVIERCRTEFNKTGNPISSIGTVHDISERRKVEHELFLLKEKYKIIADNTYDWEYWRNENDECIYVSPSVEKITGYKPNDFLSDKGLLEKIIHPDDKESFRNHEHSKNGKGERETIEFRIITPEKRVCWIGHVCQEVFGTNGDYLGVRGNNRDISEQKELENKLKASEEKFRSFYNDITLAVVVFDIITDENNKPINFVCVDVNPMYEKLTHLKRENIIGKSIFDIIPKLEQKWIDIFGKVVQTEEPISTIEHSDFLNKHWDTKAFKTKNNQLTVTFSDITERIKAEQALQESSKKLKESEDRLSKTWLAANDGMYDWDLITNEVYFDPRYYEMAGYVADEFPHKFDEFQKRIHPDDVENVIHRAQQHIEGKLARFIVEFRFKKKSGDWLWVLGRGLIVERDKNNKPLRFIGTHTDITDRKKAEQDLLKSKQKFESMILNSPNLIMTQSTNSKIEYVSPQCERILGYTAEEIKNTDMKKLFHPDDKDKVIKTELTALKGTGINNFEYRFIKKNGESVWLGHTARPIIIDGEITEILSTVRDVTRRKLIANELKENEAQLRESNQTKDKFFSIIAHDLRSPFSSILGLSEILNHNFDKYDTEKKKKIIGLMHTSINRTYKLLDNLLIWSSSQRGMIVFNPEELNLYLLSLETIEFVNQAAENKSIKILNQISEDIYINADRELLSIIIRNLLSNAIKFTPKGGEIKTVARIISDKNNTKAVEVTISDNGVGIPDEIQTKLFDVGQDTSTKGTDNETGTGLGLVLCKEFVEKHNGEIWVKSEIGKGSEFIFSIPNIVVN